MTIQPTGQQPDTDRRSTVDQLSTDRDALTIAEAATRLGLSTDAVRSRLHRGTLPGERTPDGWTVFLPRTAPTVAQPSATVEQLDPDRAPTVADGRFVRALEERIIAQAEEIAFLRDQLDQRSRELAAERERSDVIQQLALNRIPSLATGPSATDVTVGQSPPRADPPSDPLQPPGSTEPAKMTPDTLQSQRSWWRFWER